MPNTINWKKVVERHGELLTFYQIAKGRKFYPETLEIDFKPKRIKYENGWYYLDKKELKKEYKTFLEKYREDPDFFLYLARKAKEMGENLVQEAKKASSNLKGSNEKLKKAFSSYDKSLQKFASFAWVIFPVEKLLTDQLKKKLQKAFPKAKEEELEKYLQILTTPKEPTSAKQEQRRIFEIAKEVKKKGINKAIKKKIKKLYSQFRYLGAVRVGWTYFEEPYDLKHYKDVIREAALGNPNERLEELEKKKREQEKEYKELKKKVTEAVLKDAKILRKFVSLRTKRGEYIVKSMLAAKPLLKEIASRFNISLEDLGYFTSPEIKKLLEEGKKPDFEVRKEGFNLRMENSHFEIQAVKPKKKVKWKKLMSRPTLTPLLISSLMKGYEKEVPKITGSGIHNFLFISSGKQEGSTFYVDRSEWKRLGQKVMEKIEENEEFPSKHAKECIEACKSLVRTSKEIKKEKLENKSNLELLHLLRRHQEELKEFIPFLAIPVAVDKILTKKFKKKLKQIVEKEKLYKKYLKTLTKTTKILDSEREEIDLLRIANKIQKGGGKISSEIEEGIENHAKKYGWISVYAYHQDPLTKEDFVKRAKEVKDPKRKLEEKRNKRREKERKIKRVKKKLKGNKKLLDLIEALQEFIYLRTYRTNMLRKAFYHLKSLIEEIGSRAGFSKKEISYLTSEELERFLKKEKLPDKSEIRRRIRHFLLIKKPGIKKIISNKERIEEIKRRELREEKRAKVEELKGNPAYRGCVKGTVKLIESMDEAGKFKKGDILVTSMTTPDMTPLIGKASAIVTDEGGITCHAAIVSREFKIPCIIGTKNATKVLKDGERVKINEKGTIKKIK